MKPTKKMLGRLGASTSGRAEAGEAAPEPAREGAGREAAAVVKPASAKLTASELMERVAALGATLLKIDQPPLLGVRAKGTENLPSPEAWKAARDRALQRLKALQSRLKETQSAGEKVLAAPAVPAGEAALDPGAFARELEQMSRTIDVRQPPKKEG